MTHFPEKNKTKHLLSSFKRANVFTRYDLSQHIVIFSRSRVQRRTEGLPLLLKLGKSKTCPRWRRRLVSKSIIREAVWTASGSHVTVGGETWSRNKRQDVSLLRTMVEPAAGRGAAAGGATRVSVSNKSDPSPSFDTRRWKWTQSLTGVSFLKP